MQLKVLLRFTSPEIFGAATYIGLLIFVLALPFGYSTAFLNIGLSFVLLGWVGRLVSERKLGWQRTSLDLPILLFLGLALIASLLRADTLTTSSLGYFWKLPPSDSALLCCCSQPLGDPVATCRDCLSSLRQGYLLPRLGFGITQMIPA